MTPWLVWATTAATVVCVVTRPGRLPEWVYAVAGALVVALSGALPWAGVGHAVGEGLDVYLFLAGMLLLSELARREGLFDWVAQLAAQHARGSGRRLFALVFATGVVVTTFLSNDATAVVLTPAVIAVARKARAPMLPLLFACAFVANAASFVLPISNPANLVMFGTHMPPLPQWLARFGLPSLAAIVLTYAVLAWSQRRALAGTVSTEVPLAPIHAHARLTLFALAATALVLMLASWQDWSLGWPTAVMAALAVLTVSLRGRSAPWPVLAGVNWGVLPLVAGLFVLVEALRQTGLVATLAGLLRDQLQAGTVQATWVVAATTTVAGNVANNLPVGLLTSATLAQAAPPEVVRDAALIAVDLGPNIAVSGSLATLLWLSILRREGEHVGFFQFLRLGLVVTLPALAAAIALRLALG
ncbi:arsenic transporter [Pseudoxanthomonas winnipegensis]|jgi:arsenical pump membrane protein|uniref:Arsenic transporter n=1 Tax=Pseudoxanthomonas winnipegensis TaxID=2480810 RepID=A0ABY1WC81_9GAMM|nr:arsenic transporter [Pseudoxanthomonas winnipegensis]TAA11169.1 arsenic transporter [Pseudoxanthomonas winnipegensis]TAA18594.1 arsenic transporter [Pseudoxanthomonas winnipegensis]TAH74030.1 arsenic transporter [Pseudoxanthomonas winnipegensis]